MPSSIPSNQRFFCLTPWVALLLLGACGYNTIQSTDEAAAQAKAAIDHARHWLRGTAANRIALEAGARRFGLTLGRALALALLVEAAEWSLEHEHDGRARAAALRFARTPIDLIADADPRLDAALANDEPLSVL